MSLAKKGKQPHNFGKEQPSTSGILNPAADNGIYTFINLDGRKFIGNRYDFLKEHPEITRKQLGKLFITKPNKIAMGWSILEFKYKFDSGEKTQEFDFVEVSTGTHLTCSVEHLSNVLGVPPKYIQRMLTQTRGRKTTFGWTTKEYYDNCKKTA
jgi:hypothetical protein